MTDTQLMQPWFEFEFCGECNGDENHHRLVELPTGTPFAQCMYPRDFETGDIHPVIRQYLAENFPDYLAENISRLTKPDSAAN